MNFPALVSQARFVLFGLLKTASALAESRTISSWPTAAAAATWMESKTYALKKCTEGSDSSIASPATFLTLRLAGRTDVPSIQSCNLATLPENYQPSFYIHHLRQWTELSFVVVEEGQKEEQRSQRTFFRPFSRTIATTPPTVVAYLLGKVEHNLVEPETQLKQSTLEEILQREEEDDVWCFSPNRRRLDFHATSPKTVPVGHITSIAVLPEYRRRGIAQDLLAQLHHQLERHLEQPGTVGLHVRKSNAAAIKLYQDRFGYKIKETLKCYYQDGEDGLYMVKDLESNKNNQAVVTPLSTTFLPPWRRSATLATAQLKATKTAKDLAMSLPRRVGSKQQQQPPVTKPCSKLVNTEEEAKQDQQLLTGVM